MARKHMVICQVCGRQFDMNAEGGYRNKSTGRHVCKDCYRKAESMSKQQQKEQRKADGIARRGMKQTYLAMFLKIFCGAAAITAALKSHPVFIVVGVALILLGVIPFIRRGK